MSFMEHLVYENLSFKTPLLELDPFASIQLDTPLIDDIHTEEP
jgi:hypothetical protein